MKANSSYSSCRNNRLTILLVPKIIFGAEVSPDKTYLALKTPFFVKSRWPTYPHTRGNETWHSLSLCVPAHAAYIIWSPYFTYNASDTSVATCSGPASDMLGSKAVGLSNPPPPPPRSSFQPYAEDETGEGAGLSFEACHRSFDGLAACGVNDTAIRNSRVAKKGGAVAIGSGDGRSNVEFHRCTVDNSSTGEAIKDDPQGEGGAFSVGGGVTLLLADSVVKRSYCGKKVLPLLRVPCPCIVFAKSGPILSPQGRSSRIAPKPPSPTGILNFCFSSFSFLVSF